jgi:hypothetical protein
VTNPATIYLRYGQRLSPWRREEDEGEGLPQLSDDRFNPHPTLPLGKGEVFAGT